MPLILTFLILGLVVYRVTRFIILDDLIEGTRDRVLNGLLAGRSEDELGSLPLWRRKLYTLLNCPFCVSIYVAAGVVLAHRWIVEPLPAPVWWWLGTATVALVVYTYIDSEE